MKEAYEKHVSMYCPTCGGQLFEAVDKIQCSLVEAPDATLIRCAKCSSKFTKKELSERNQETINANFSELTNEVFEDLKKDFSKMLKNTFKGR